MFLTKSSKSPASIAKSNKQWVGTCLFGYEQVAKADCEYPIEYVCRRLRVTANGVNSND